MCKIARVVFYFNSLFFDVIKYTFLFSFLVLKLIYIKVYLINKYYSLIAAMF